MEQDQGEARCDEKRRGREPHLSCPVRGGNLLLVLLPLVCFVLMTWGFLWLCPQDFVTLSVRLKSENRFAAQIFWCSGADGKFDRYSAMTKTVENGDVRECSFRIPNQKVCRLRFDFGKNPGRVEVIDMRLLGAKNEILDLGKFTFSQDVESHSVTGDGKLLVSSKKADPFMVYDHPLDVAPGFMPEWTSFGTSSSVISVPFVVIPHFKP